MKPFNTILLGIAGLVLAHSASAATYTVYIAGSNGDRNATNQAIANVLSGETIAYTINNGGNGTLTTSNFTNFNGGTYGGHTWNIRVAYLGATAGLQYVASTDANDKVRFLPESATGAQNPNPGASVNAAEYQLAKPNFGVSTNFQSTSPFVGEYKGKNYNTLTEILTGAVALQFLGSKGFPADNLTTAQAQKLYKTGTVPLAFFTGLVADRTKIVFAIGRNSDAGQRFGAQAEIGIGVNAVVNQWQPGSLSGTSPNIVVGSHQLWPQETVSGVDSGSPGNSGFTTGADLRVALLYTLSAAAYQFNGTIGAAATGGYYLGYLTPSDANLVIPSGAVPLKWNGVTYTEAALKEGQYTAWVYTRIVYDPEQLDEGGDTFTFLDALKTEIRNNTIVTPGGGVKLVDLQVRRGVESGPLTPVYYP
jgi:hypothetical protein